MPHRYTMQRWIGEKNVDGSWRYPEFRAALERARPMQAASWFEQVVDIADRKAQSPGSVSRDKLRIDTRKWVMSKIDPGRYGEKVSVETGPALELTSDSLRPIARALVAALGSDGLRELKALAGPAIDAEAEVIDGKG
jgi:hypothetical protein